jgi:glycosyltransferase involved in cell wall biosynthesis
MPESLKNKIAFSLIVATVDRFRELEIFLESIVNQTIDLSTVEVIVVDQNHSTLISPLIKKYKKKLANLLHIKSNQLGVSLNRNIGISVAKGQIFSFPDDDCFYYPDTLFRVFDFFNNNKNVDFLLGAVINRTSGEKLIRSWPENHIKITKSNFFFLYTMITVFTKCKINFDERFGGGANYLAYEDADFIYSHLLECKSGEYVPCIHVSHPQLNIDNMSDDKIFKYGDGFGAFCKKNFSFFTLFIFFGAIALHAFKLLISLFFLNITQARKRYVAIFSRLNGWIRFR